MFDLENNVCLTQRTSVHLFVTPHPVNRDVALLVFIVGFKQITVTMVFYKKKKVFFDVLFRNLE